MHVYCYSLRAGHVYQYMYFICTNINIKLYRQIGIPYILHAFTMCELEREIDVIGVELFQIEYRKLINFEKTICHILSRCMKKSKNTSCW